MLAKQHRPYNDMLSPTEKVLLQELLEIAPIPEGTLTYHELMGFMFGLAITPIHIDRDEWLDAVFGEEPGKRYDARNRRPLANSLTQIYAAFLARQEQGQLHFPYPIEVLKETDINEVREWVSGLEEAFSLRPDIWEPQAEGNFADFSDGELEELFFCMMVIQGLADPVEVKHLLDRLPDEALDDLFAAYELESEEKDRNFQALLLGALPLAVQALQSFSKKIRPLIPEHAQPASNSVGKTEPPPKSFSTLGETGTTRSGSKIIQVDFTRKTVAEQPAPSQTDAEQVPYYQLKISIKDANPPIWRRMIVPGAISLAQFHQVIQISMGWQNTHLHQFRTQNTNYGPDEYELLSESQLSEDRCTLHQAIADVHKSFQYIYDFGDYWQHQILIEKSISAQEFKDSEASPKVIKGRRACPPENIGGILGYQEFLEAYTNPSHDEHSAMLDWAGPDFRPERFDAKEVDEINRLLSSIIAD